MEEINKEVETEQPEKIAQNPINWRLNKEVEPEPLEGYKWLYTKAGWRKYRLTETPIKPKIPKKPKVTYLYESDSESEEEYIIVPKKRNTQPKYRGKEYINYCNDTGDYEFNNVRNYPQYNYNNNPNVEELEENYYNSKKRYFEQEPRAKETTTLNFGGYY